MMNLLYALSPMPTASSERRTTTITVERFYGTPSIQSGDFQDTIIVAASEVHSFTDSTLIRFPDTAAVYVYSINPALDTLWAVVGAGSSNNPLTFINLLDDMMVDRDTVTSYWTFSGAGAVDDPFEPNDGFPLPDTAAVNVSNALPFEAYLSIDPDRTPGDTLPSEVNFFWLSNPGPGDITVDIRAETQQDADIDFFVCNGVSNPPTDYDGTACARNPALNGTGRVEEELGEVLSPGRHVFAFYCVSGCSTVPVTYKVNIQ